MVIPFFLCISDVILLLIVILILLCIPVAITTTVCPPTFICWIFLYFTLIYPLIAIVIGGIILVFLFLLSAEFLILTIVSFVCPIIMSYFCLILSIFIHPAILIPALLTCVPPSCILCSCSTLLFLSIISPIICLLTIIFLFLIFVNGYFYLFRDPLSLRNLLGRNCVLEIFKFLEEWSKFWRQE